MSHQVVMFGIMISLVIWNDDAKKYQFFVLEYPQLYVYDDINVIILMYVLSCNPKKDALV